MTQTEKKIQKTDLAWKQVYARLEQDGLLGQPAEKPAAARFRIGLIKWAAVLLALCGVVGTAIFLRQPDPHTTSLLTLQNNESSTTLVTTLEDGSIVYLADKSTLTYPEHFEERKREVVLKGNALFDVSGNRERPFLIETEEMFIRVIGTSFNVNSSTDHSFELAVRRGEVEVTRKKNGEHIQVQAGQTVSIQGNQLQITATQDQRQFAYYTQRIQFKDQRLADILRVINLEHPDVPLKTTVDLEDRRLTVSFHNNSPATMAELICLALNLKCTEENSVWMITQP